MPKNFTTPAIKELTFHRNAIAKFQILNLDINEKDETYTCCFMQVFMSKQ